MVEVREVCRALVEWLNPGPNESWSHTDSRDYVTALCARLSHKGRTGLCYSGRLQRSFVDPRTRVAGLWVEVGARPAFGPVGRAVKGGARRTFSGGGGLRRRGRVRRARRR